MNPKGILLFFSCLISGMTVFAQDSLNVVKWNLQTCLDYAKKNNIQVSGARLSQQTSQQELILSRGAALPNLYGSATQYVNHYHNEAVYGSGNYGLTSSWTLYQGGYIKSDIRQKNLEVERANLSILQQVNDLTLQITQYYLNILLDKETIIYQQNVVATSQAQVDRAKKRLEAGSIAQKDVAQLLAQLANDKYTLVTAENAQRQDLISLKQLLQLTVATFDVVTPDTIISKKAVDKLLNVQQTALKDRPEVKNGELNIKSAEFGLQKANSGYLPTLTASGFAGSSYQGAGSGYFNQLNNGFNQQIGLTLSVPIFTRKVNQVNRAEAKINIDQARLSLKDTQTTLALTIEKAYINVVNSQNQYDAAAEAFKYNQETYRVANEQLKVGIVNMVDFLQQKSLYTQALQQYIQAKYNAALTIEIYEFYKGTPVKL
ncbi:TolC family protein [Mucilaginibacter sp. BJC16-A38]|uniref:TolC family protein n=1 Tax=Mucilaginibacter phenanthrenivorans TaxID=1234842 RepID=UPI00215788CB|nr:TolC family protein [Mucilaginibacter phenanthrenivorans]MCR8556522.1 TolC family protein [Mucilaginibacter phenanthrenivorans]